MTCVQCGGKGWVKRGNKALRCPGHSKPSQDPLPLLTPQRPSDVGSDSDSDRDSNGGNTTLSTREAYTTFMRVLSETNGKPAAAPHTVAPTGQPPGYPQRARVSDTSWEAPDPTYQPIEFEAPVLATAPWAAPARPPHTLAHSAHPVQHDDTGRPLNPAGRTGMTGRGLLGQWGPNHAADPIITRNNPQTGQLEVLLIRRKDTTGNSNQWAIPGGMVDPGELASETAKREFEEEVGIELDMSDAQTIYTG